MSDWAAPKKGGFFICESRDYRNEQGSGPSLFQVQRVADDSRRWGENRQRRIRGALRPKRYRGS